MNNQARLHVNSGRIIAFSIGLAIISACSMDAKTQPAPELNLQNTVWQLKLLADQPVNNVRPLTLQFAENRLSGYAGCNSFFGSYIGSGDGVFSAGALGATKMACDGTRDTLEQTYLTALRQAKQFAVSRDQLHLLDANRKVLMVFSPIPNPSNP